MNKKTHLIGRTGSAGSSATENKIASSQSLPHSPLSPTFSYNKSHTLPSPLLSNDDFEQIPGLYVKKHFYFKKYGKGYSAHDYE